MSNALDFAPGQRVLVIGVSGSGKTTFAKRLAELRGYTHIEMDALYWEENWKPADEQVVRERLRAAMSASSWVMDGNYSKFRDMTWSNADTVVWLDYGLPLILWRLFVRTIGRAFSGEKLWGKNRESFVSVFFSHDSLFLWAVKTYFKYGVEYEQLLKSDPYKGLKSVRFKNPFSAELWLASQK